MTEAKRTIFDIMRFSIRDGPGIRTTVFFKGCPLDCWWCHNPEGRESEREVVVRSSRCIRCGACSEACPTGAVTGDGPCTFCGKCITACPTGAREFTGRAMTVNEIVAEVLKDRPFFEDSGGGVTFSGGEPLMDVEFLLPLLARCRSEGIHAAVDTCGHVPPETLERVRDQVDLFLYDLKLVDPERHRAFTGVSNELILGNLRELAAHHPRILVRMPVIPGYNDDPENVERTGALLADLGIGEIQILPYHATATQKYAQLGREYRLGEVLPPTHERLAEIAGRLEAHGLKVHVGGHTT